MTCVRNSKSLEQSIIYWIEEVWFHLENWPVETDVSFHKFLGRSIKFSISLMETLIPEVEILPQST